MTAMADPTKDLALRQDRPVLDVTAYEPRSLNQAMQMAQVLANSGLLGKVEPRPEAVLYLMARGRELGFTATQSIAAFAIIDGVPTLYAQSQVALCARRRDVCQYIRCVETSGQQATWATLRVGHPDETRLTYTIEDARLMGLLEPPKAGRQPGPWHKQPAVMLRWRAATALIRMVYPDLVLGLYDPDEMREIIETTGRSPVDQSIRVIDSAAVTEVMGTAAETFGTDEPESDDGDASALAAMAAHPTPVPVPGVTRPWQAGDPCPTCAEMRLRGKFNVAKFGPHEGELQCTGKKGETWLNHLAPKPAGTVEANDPCAACAEHDPPLLSRSGAASRFYNGAIGLICTGWDTAADAYIKHQAPRGSVPDEETTDA